MEHWELEAREAIRDLVARYNANGDAGRFAQVIELFAPDAVMEGAVDGKVHHDPGEERTYTGRDEIMTIFTATQDRVQGGEVPVYMRHMTATHQIDVIDHNFAKGRCYWAVLSPIGLDQWGRYIDEYRKVDGRWLFSHRRVTMDGQSTSSLFAPAAAKATEG